MLRLLSVLVFLALAAVPATAADVLPAKAQQLLDLLNDKDVQQWLASRKQPEASQEDDTPVAALTSWDQRLRDGFSSLRSAVPIVFSEISAAASRVRQDARANGFAPAFLLFIGFILLGLAAEWIFKRVIMARHASKTDDPDRATVPAIFDLYVQFAPLAVFIAVIAIVYFAVDWPPLLRVVLLAYLAAFALSRLVAAASRYLLAIGTRTARKRRLIRIGPYAATFIHRRTVLFACILLFGIATASLGRPLGVDPRVTHLISYTLSVGMLLITVETLWRRPREKKASTLGTVLLTIYVVLLWALWCFGLSGIFWLGVFALILPPLLKAVTQTAEAFTSTKSGDLRKNVRSILVIRGSRAVVIALAVVWVALAWRYNPNSLSRDDPTSSAIIRGLFKSVIVLLIADLVWHIIKAFIDSKLRTFSVDPDAHGGAAASQHRIATLLPIFRNALAVFVLVAAALTVLSEMGVEIGPLIAGAGIFGVAIGFGSQTLVKDIISGVFYMLDDAFRVGEYIQSGSYKGTVESFSLRSVRLRHHRGPIFTVPFGVLGAVQNMSRDWVIDKFMLRVPFDTDIAKVKKLVKTIGAEMMADPEIAPFILQTIKMKGVEQIGDFGIELSFAFTTQPGHQSAIRRRAYTMIRDSFRANGIEFAQPTVQVGGDEKAASASAAAASASRTMAATKAAAAQGEP